MGLRMTMAVVLVVAFGAQGVAEMDWKHDAALGTWPELLLPGWTLRAEGDLLRVERTDGIHLLGENKINAPLSRESSAQRSDRIRRHGKAATARLVFRLRPKPAARELWTGPLPQYLSSGFTVDLVEKSGFEDEMHSVDPPEASQEFWTIENRLLGTLAIVLSAGSSLESWTGRRVALIAVKSVLMAQHMMSYPEGFDFSEYVDFGRTQSVAYTREPLKGDGPWELTATVTALGGDNDDPRRKETVREYHLQVWSVRDW